VSTPRERDKLSRTLRDLRKDAGLTLAQVAERVGMTVRTISRYEGGHIVPSVKVVEQLSDALAAKPAQRRELVRMAADVRESTESRLVFLRAGSGGAQRMQERIKRAEAASQHVGSFANQLVVGMLQTPDYMRAVFASVDLTEADVVGAVASRQARLTQALAGGRDYTQVLTEGALMWNLGGAEVMADQAAHIARLAVEAPPHFRIGIIPSTRPSGVTAMGSFDLYDTRVSVVGTDVATAWMTNPKDVQAYRRHFDRLVELADFGEAAVPTLDRVRRWYGEVRDGIG
jgi:transcriptional regulator with XRE-family HTH domain